MKKYLPYILILIALVGFFGHTEQVNAEERFCHRTHDIPPTCYPYGNKQECFNSCGGGTCQTDSCPVIQTEDSLGICVTKQYIATSSKVESKKDCEKRSGWEWLQNDWGDTEEQLRERAKNYDYERCKEDAEKKGETDEEKRISECRALVGLPPLPPLPKGDTTPKTDPWDGKYKLLAPLPEIGKTFDPSQPNALSNYLNKMIVLFIGICAILSVVMIVVGGIEYMTSELAHSKEAGKEKISQAIFGLLIALGSYALLNTINPDLLKTDLGSLRPLVIKVTDEDFIVINDDGSISSGTGGEIKQSSVGTTCDARTIREADGTITPKEAATFSCLITPESGCQSVENYRWGKGTTQKAGSTAYGYYQITLKGNGDCFENEACYAAVGATGPLNCRAGFDKIGNPIPGSQIVEQCRKAADNFTCSTKAAKCVLRRQGFGAWTADVHSAKQQKCIDKQSI